MNGFSATLGNVKVKNKLAIGFGLVLLLTVLIALTSWRSLVHISESSAQFDRISAMDQLSFQIDHAVLDYQIHYRDQDRDRANQLIAELKTAQHNEASRLGEAQSKAQLEALIALTDRYQEAFDKLHSAIETGISNTSLQTQFGQQVITAFNDIEASLRHNAEESTPQDLLFALGLIESYRDFLLGRFSLLQFQQDSHNQSLQEQGLDLISHGFDRLKQLRDEGLDTPPIQAALKASNSYLMAYRGTVRSMQAQADAINAMEQATEQLQKVSAELYQTLLTKRSADLQHTIKIILASAVAAIISGLVISQLITGQIVVPLNRSLESADRIASGDLSVYPLSARSDEFGQFELRLAAMRDSLRSLIASIDQNVGLIASSAEELSAVTTQTNAGAKRQLEVTSQSSQGMQEMSATVDDVAQNAEKARHATNQAEQEAHSMNELAQQTLTQITTLSNEVSRSVTAMGELQAESAKISSVLDVIKNVAEQTNLLALNAAIEAARAGEAGRGFAVVADEVRGLAQRTQNSTSEIESLIASLQNRTEQAVSTMQNSHNLTERTVELGQMTERSLATFSQMISTIQAMNQQIATAAEEQSSMANELARGVVSVQEISEQTATASGQTAAASQELASLGANLQAQIRHFKL